MLDENRFAKCFGCDIIKLGVNMLVLEVGIKLDKNLRFYHNMLEERGAKLILKVETRDKYWSNRSFYGLTENEIKKSCVRLRASRAVGGLEWNGKKNPIGFSFDNYSIFDSNADDKFKVTQAEARHTIKNMEKKRWDLVFDTKKVDYQYAIGDMKSRIQLQQIDGIGLVLYYDNPDYYHLPEDKQRRALIKELNSYGFNIPLDTLGIDKLRTLYTKKECFSINQNG